LLGCWVAGLLGCWVEAQHQTTQQLNNPATGSLRLLGRGHHSSSGRVRGRLILQRGRRLGGIDRLARRLPLGTAVRLSRRSGHPVLHWSLGLFQDWVGHPGRAVLVITRRRFASTGEERQNGRCQRDFSHGTDEFNSCATTSDSSCRQRTAGEESRVATSAVCCPLSAV
jgi:hypothetical protein